MTDPVACARRFGLPGLAALALLAYSSVGLASSTAPGLVQETCYLKGLADRAECFQLQVPEDPAQPDGATLPLHAARLPALTPSTQPPLAILAGGPGQSAIEVGGTVGQAFQALRADRDILLLEQRGTGKSHGLKCEDPEADPYQDLFDSAQSARIISNCLADFPGQLRHYNTPNAIVDFARMVRALGYEKVHLYGGSYGSRAALVFMREYPELVASAVIDGLAPVQTIVGPFAQHGLRALNLLFDECENSPACAQKFPNLRADYWALWQGISSQESPQAVPIRHPKTLAPHTLALDKYKFFQLTLSNLYAQEQRQLLPFAISEAAKGNWHPFAGLMAIAGDNGMYTGLTTNILCNEDLRRASPGQLAADSATPFGDTSVALLQQLCAQWPGEYRLDASHFAPVESNLPVLALSGRLDPVTPPAWGELATSQLGNATHLVAENAAHIVALRGCGPELVRAFLNNPNAALEDTACLAELPGVTFMRNENAH
ncbi:alpha/beta hydrolase [Simiduia sp. 21SJ11W-1]|uniref:alpha/beta hydrolase n=1 Tax=Simiduia sp. 21SJ11W-1 TaxID=2909669 RepID=UPI0020A12E0E|nr:alpha/beta fold hydrolase [Simiduia sp. 21SJ11W-1]UTA46913.1 alpha/beta hydrolase [Simiduia sp. 21SJ11W-1]